MSCGQETGVQKSDLDSSFSDILDTFLNPHRDPIYKCVCVCVCIYTYSPFTVSCFDLREESSNIVTCNMKAG
jgi:hypothetical protein